MKKETILIVDALNLFTRHFIAHPALSENGDHVGGIVGFLYAIADLSEKCHPKSLIVVWEGGGSSKRRSIFPEYKRKRKPQKLNRFYDEIPDTVENRNHQISALVSIMNSMPILQMYIPDCEADDVIGYLCRYLLKDRKKVIISSDRDFYQLLDNKTVIYSPTWKKFVNSIEVKEKFNISPENFCMAKSICGDPSDNIPGVKGVGFKTLSKRFPQFAQDETFTFESFFNLCQISVDEGSKLQAFPSILSDRDKILRNWKLTYLDTSNLSPGQIKKTEFLFSNFNPSRHKINATRSLLKEGIKTFNIDRMFLSLKNVGEI